MQLPELHRSFLERALEVLGADLRVVGVAAAGSYECLDLLGFLRRRVLGPMALYASGQRGLDAQGLRRFERLASRWAPRLAATVGGLDRDSCLGAISTCCDIYAELRDALGLEPDGAVETEVRRYLAAAARGA